MADWNNGANAGGDFSEPAYDEHGGNDGFGYGLLVDSVYLELVF